MRALDGTNEQIRCLPGNDVGPIFFVIGTVFLNKHTALCHREKRFSGLNILGHWRAVEQARHFLKRPEIRADTPNHEISVRAPADSGICVDEKVAAKIFDRFDELLFAVSLISVIEHAPFGTRTIKNEVDELTWKFAFVLFHLLNVRRQTQSASCGIVWRFVFSAHVDESKSFETGQRLKATASVEQRAHLFCCESIGFCNLRAKSTAIALTCGHHVML